MAKSSLCVRCFKLGITQHHHVLPVRFFGENDKTINLCHACHQKIEATIPHHSKLTQEQYLDIHKAWLQGKPVLVVLGGRHAKKTTGTFKST
jgi:hypothetical protein